MWISKGHVSVTETCQAEMSDSDGVISCNWRCPQGQVTLTMDVNAAADMADRLSAWVQDMLIRSSREQCQEALPPVDVIDVEETLTAEQLRQALKRE